MANTKLHPGQWAYGAWWTYEPGQDPQLMDPQPPAPPQDAQGQATGVPEGWE
ncbi:hypothetical protein [Amycolatopsis sp. NPDC051903]|uniref:hypothetical protein n=1 Tax=Amycolatopsis sp. NPDC051903 TaxID=3363936 RepID=UPI0037A50B06